ncbi:hypothetical protein BC831DRAFT_464982 [Entophlyctis helioformis]|nr:hypothetical protein BC831DRAFT_464982 [Entophlyctis helioformis]
MAPPGSALAAGTTSSSTSSSEDVETLKASVRRSVARIVAEQAGGKAASPEFVYAVAELVAEQASGWCHVLRCAAMCCHVLCSYASVRLSDPPARAELMGSDLEAFARHGKRSGISVDDVKLYARRNPKLLAAIDSHGKP